jgi:hypothetical protein
VLYDISHPHDLRVTLGKPSISTAEIDQFLADSAADPEVKRKLLAEHRSAGIPRPIKRYESVLGLIPEIEKTIGSPLKGL